MADTTAPTSEIGNLTGYGSTGITDALPWQAFVEQGEYAPDLKWPNSVREYDRMFTDAQVKGLFLGSMRPIERFRWQLDPNNARDVVVQGLARDLNLPIKGDDEFHPGRRRNRFSHHTHLADALKAPGYGFYYFELVGEIGPDGLWHLVKLAPRHPRTIGQIYATPGGELVKVAQRFGLLSQPIPADRLVTYVWEQEAGSWVGRSMLRACYRDWLIKDRLMRVDAIKHERNGVGMPVVEAPPGASKPEIDALNALANTYRAGESGGGAIPNGSKLTLQGTQGTLPDTVASMNFHNEEMARSFLMMFMQLGQTQSGSRALGSDFLDFFGYAQEAIADWYVDTFTSQVIEYWVDVNYGPDEAAPVLSYDRSSGEDLSAQDLANLVKTGAITVDDGIENQIRRRYGFLPLDPDEPSAPAVGVTEETSPPPAVQATARERRRRVAAASSSLSLPDRELRRQPYPQEIAAKVDYALMDAQMQSLIDKLVGEVSGLQAGQIDALAAAIKDADGDLTKLAALEADPVFEEVISEAMSTMAAQGVEQAMGEAERQGITPKAADFDADALANRARAVDTLLSRSLSEAAGRKAMSLTGGSLSPADVASQTKDYLSGLTDNYLQEQLGGTLVQAMNTGRKAVFAENPPKYLYASELLDENACEECVAIDGTEYDSLEDAEADYPTGGYCECLGGPRCRGTLVAVHVDEEEPSE